MSSIIGQIHKATKWTLPLEHWSLEGLQKVSSKSVEQTSDGLAQAAEKVGINSHLPRYWEGKADKDNHSFNRWGENSLGGALGTVAGMWGWSALAGGGSGTTGVTGSNGAFLGEGAPSGIGSWDGAAGGMGLDFDPNGLPQGSKFASDFPTKGSGGFNWDKLAQGVAKGQQQQPAQRPLQQDEWKDPEKVRLEGDLTLSSRQLKRPARGASRGLSEIDVNGAEIEDLQRITKRVIALRRAVAQLKGAHA